MDANQIRALYKKYNYPGAAKLYNLLNGEVKLSVIKKALEDEDVRQLYYQRPHKAGGHITAFYKNEKWQCDLCFMDKFGQQNGGYKYLLLCIDVLTRYAWAIPLKTKNVNEVVAAFAMIGDKPDVLMSDNGSEFTGKPFQEMLNQMGVTHQTAIVGDHKALGIIDRFTLTLKNMIYKTFIGDDNTKWKDKIDEIINAYNHLPHKTLKNMTPAEVYEDKGLQSFMTDQNIQKSYKKNVPVVSEGDTVRVRIPDTKFTRGFHPKWADVQKIDAKKGNTVMIDGKKYKVIDVQKVTGKNTGEALKEALKTAKVDRKIRAEGIEKHVEPEEEYGKNLVGRAVKDGKDKGVIFKYVKYGEFKWWVRFDGKRDDESMNLEEIKRMLL